MNKYRNRVTVIDGIRFDSRREAIRYKELKILESAGEIAELKSQPTFQLQESFKYKNKTIRGISYKADFSYYQNGRLVVEDVKGMETDVFKIKKKLFLKKYGDCDFRIVR